MGSPFGVVATIVLLAMVIMPVLAIAEDAATPESDVPAVPAAVPVEPAFAPAETIVEEPSSEAPIVEEPLVEEEVSGETELDEPVSDEAPQAPADPEPEVEEEEPAPQVWTNTDTLWLNDGIAQFTLNPGESATIPVGFSVTTPRESTMIHARLDGAGDDWSIASTELADSDPAAASAIWTESSTLAPDASFILTIVVTAPKEVAEDHTVPLVLASTATVNGVQEAGVVETWPATITAVAPRPQDLASSDPTSDKAMRSSGVTAQFVPGDSLTVTNCTSPTPDAEGYAVLQAGGVARFSCQFTADQGPSTLSRNAQSTEGWQVGNTGTAGPFNLDPPQAQGNYKAGTYTFYLKTNEVLGTGEYVMNIVLTNGTPVGYLVLKARVVPPPCQTPTAPISLGNWSFTDPFDTLVWSGSWGISHAELSMPFSRTTCGASSTVQVQIVDTNPGLRPEVGVDSVWGTGVTGVSPLVGDPMEGAVTVANVTTGFNGPGGILLDLSVTPDDELPPDSYPITIQITTMPPGN